ncbi:CAP domain-containing protein [Erythrobacter alti]|uniref:CAP domain-containing protein n=1 Tax=Erythrobacter alti TaxID=1896145 RepID=UPI0030F40481
MDKGRVIAAACAAIATLCVSAAPLSAGEQRANPFAQELLVEHNEARDDVGVPRLEWSQRLAQQAQTWAEQLAREGGMRHSSREQRGGAGENLWMGAAGYYGADVMVGAFVDERRHFRRGTFPNVSTTGQWRDVGHYTQIIWRDTREVGCAVARGRENDFLVCHYWPAGNTYDRPVY